MKRRDLLIGGFATAVGATAGARLLRADRSVAHDAGAAATPRSTAGHADRPNILMISIDDMKPWIGPHAFEGAHTPALDELARRGVVFRKAYCAAPACSPSRAAVFTGRAPYQTGCYFNRHSWLDISPRPTTFPRLLRESGYHTAGFGKLFHIINHDDRSAWDERQHYSLYKMPGAPINAPESIYRRSGSRFDWAALDIPDEKMDDHHQVNRAVAAMKGAPTQPWFVAVGIFRPHLPRYAPRRFFDLYPLDSVPMPEVIPDDLEDVPERGRHFAKQYEHRVIVENDLWRPAVQAYLASISYVDYELGRLLEQTPPDTNIILWSDHGWHLGPKNHWHKYALWEEASQTVFAMAGPDTAAGEMCHRPVSLNDIYPTVCELSDLSPPHELAGRSVLPLARTPSALWDGTPITTHGPGNHAVRSERYRYIRYSDGGEELYDHEVDPHEWHNLANTPEAEPISAAHAALLPNRNASLRNAGQRHKHTWLELKSNRRALLPG